MSYLYSTDPQREEMLRVIGAASVDELFEQIPADLRLARPLDLPPALTELELQSEIERQAARNATGRVCFLGGGAYDHFIPAVVDEIASRGEFYTAYTPYQPEASQGSLQAFFEYQSLICRLTGMDVSNASLYEGGTAVSEAAFMAMRVTNRNERVVVLESVHPEYRQILETYTHNLPAEVGHAPRGRHGDNPAGRGRPRPRARGDRRPYRVRHLADPELLRLSRGISRVVGNGARAGGSGGGFVRSAQPRRAATPS